MKNLIADIKNQSFKHVYLLYGDETYLVLQYRDRLLRAILPEDNGMNVSAFDHDSFSETKVIDIAETMPFFADRRVIRIDGCGLFKSSSKLLAEYLKAIPDYCYLIFTEREVDKRSRMYKAVSAAGRCVEFKEQNTDTLSRWVVRMLAQNHIRIRPSVMDYLLEKTGTDMNHIALEVDKLIHYCLSENEGAVDSSTADKADGTETGGKKSSEKESSETESGQTGSSESGISPDLEVTKADIDAIVSDRAENRVFDMISAVTAHKEKRAMELYADLLALKEPPMRILYLIGHEYNRLLIVKELSGKGLGDSQIASSAGMPPFAVRKSRPLVRSYTNEQLLHAVRLCTHTEEQVKTGNLNDRMAVELVLMQLTQ